MRDGLYDLASEVFVHTAAVQRRVTEVDAPPAETIRSQTAALFRELDDRARSEPQTAYWDRAREALVYLLDELLAERWDWPGATEWKTQRLERTVLAAAEPQGASRFYTICDAVLAELEQPGSGVANQGARDLAAVLYVCLRLGFQGKLAADPVARRDYESRLFARLPAAAHARARVFFPEAAERTVQLDPDYRPTTRLAYLGLGFVFLVAVYLVATWGYWNDMVKDLRRTAAAVSVSGAE